MGTEQLAGQADGLAVLVKAQGPASQPTPLQVICLFDSSNPQDIYQSPPALPAARNGLVHVDQALGGQLTALRRAGHFRGLPVETLLLTPPAGTMPATRLLLLGLGSRAIAATSLESLLEQVGLTAMREALRLGVASYSFAANVQDGGLTVVPAPVTQALLTGTFAAYRTQQYVAAHQLGPPPTVRQLTMLAGPPTFAHAVAGVEQFFRYQRAS
ncbi:hypothetical protein A8B98_07240 [Hymenobacter sp. UV11]|nr:hypothetical protein A8B98_07240 [Hymenobacter sp. UV11]